MTVDPLPAVNPYIYADNCPIGSADPSGKGTALIDPYSRVPDQNSAGYQADFRYSAGPAHGDVNVGIIATDTGEVAFLLQRVVGGRLALAGDSQEVLAQSTPMLIMSRMSGANSILGALTQVLELGLDMSTPLAQMHLVTRSM